MNGESLVRDIRLQILYIEDRLPILEGRFNFPKDREIYHRLVIKLSEYGVICGSFSLFVHGLINRQPHDIDLLVDKESDIIKSLLKRNEKLISKFIKNANSSFNNVVDGFDPVAQLETNGIVLDIFHDTNVKYIEYNGIKIQCPFQVIQKKIDIYLAVYRDKDLRDLVLISKMLDRIIMEQEDRKEHEYLIG